MIYRNVTTSTSPGINELGIPLVGLIMAPKSPGWTRREELLYMDIKRDPLRILPRPTSALVHVYHAKQCPPCIGYIIYLYISVQLSLTLESTIRLSVMSEGFTALTINIAPRDR